jgi:PAS domain S-box-containing protein
MEENYLKKELYKLIQSDERIFDFIQDGSLDGLWYWDLENPENEWMNARFWKVLGYDPNEMPHKSNSWQSIINPDDLKTATDNFIRHCQDPEYPYDQIVRYTHKDGSTVWIRCRGMAIRDSNGKPIRMLGAHQDVTGFKKTEHELITQSGLVNSLLDSIPDLIFFKDKEGVYLGCNPHFAAFVGKKREDIVGKTDYDLFDKETADFFRYHDNEMLKLLKTRHNNEWITYPDGRRVFADTIKSPYYNQNGELVGILGIARDTTNRYEAEQKIRIFKTMSDDAVEGKVIADLDGNLIYVNKFLAEIHGYTQEELIGRHLSVFHTEDQMEKVREVISYLFEKGHFNPMDIWHVHRNGKEFPMLMSGTIIHDDSGKPQYISASAFDITDRKAMELELINAKTKLEERTAQLENSNMELEAFSYSVSHDLRAPLRHINGYVDLLTKRFRNELPDAALHYLDTISGASSKMGSLIDSLLHYSRSGRIEVRKREMDMNLPLQEVVDELKTESVNRIINLTIHKLPIVYADSTLIKQVWANLLGNAFKYTSKKETSEISVEYKEEENEFVFCISDNGNGFDMKYAHKLFGVFQRLHSDAEFEGTGIGLANVKRIVHKHQGRVWAESEPDKGAKFYFTIPKHKEEKK